MYFMFFKKFHDSRSNFDRAFNFIVVKILMVIDYSRVLI